MVSSQVWFFVWILRKTAFPKPLQTLSLTSKFVIFCFSKCDHSLVRGFQFDVDRTDQRSRLIHSWMFHSVIVFICRVYWPQEVRIHCSIFFFINLSLILCYFYREQRNSGSCSRKQIGIIQLLLVKISSIEHGRLKRSA